MMMPQELLAYEDDIARRMIDMREAAAYSPSRYITPLLLRCRCPFINANFHDGKYWLFLCKALAEK